ncbi:hypothetical protein ACI797_23345, partial [Geodermatophilus sp. SYSU D00691]
GRVCGVGGVSRVPGGGGGRAGIAAVRTVVDAAGGDRARAMADAGALLEEVGAGLAREVVPAAPDR